MAEWRNSLALIYTAAYSEQLCKWQSGFRQGSLQGPGLPAGSDHSEN